MKYSMRRTRNILMKELWISVALTLLIIILFETEIIVPGFFSEETNVQLFVGMIMVIVVLAFIPSSLYLFKTKHVSGLLHDDESSAPRNLLFWGTIRMMMLCVPMVVCMFLYYAFGLNVRFFYLSLICALCLFMVYPSLGRCLNETGIKSKAKDYDPDPSDDNPRS